jgi:hypothetical protein
MEAGTAKTEMEVMENGAEVTAMAAAPLTLVKAD